jgi:hypothetical protein
VQLNILWDYQAEAGGGDTHLAGFCGTRSRIEVHQGKEQNYRPELYVVPNDSTDKGGVLAPLQKKVAALASRYPGLAAAAAGDALIVQIPDTYRVGHEAHFAEVTRQFLRYRSDRSAMPAWEKPNMLAKYRVTTGGVEMAR